MAYYIRKTTHGKEEFLKALLPSNREGEWTESKVDAQGFDNGQLATNLGKTLDRPHNLDLHVVSFDNTIVNVIPGWNRF